MNYKKKIKKEAISKIDDAMPEVPRFDVVKIAPRKNVLKIALPVAVASLLAVVGTTTGLSLYYSSMKPSPDDPLSSSSAVIIQNPREARAPSNIQISDKTIQTYLTFYKTFTPLLFPDGLTQSRSFSVFDAFVNVVMISYYSDGELRETLSPFFGEATREEVAESVKELTSAIGTPLLRRGIEEGGYGANSLWYDPLNCHLRQDADLTALKDHFFASLFMDKPNDQKVTSWLKESLPEGYDVPKISIEPSTDAAFVSSYFLKTPNKNEEHEKQNKYFLNYTVNGQSKEVRGYKDGRSSGTYYENEKLIGGSLDDYNMNVFLPKDEASSPLSIVGDVLSADYQRHMVSESYTIHYPYFTIDDQRLDLGKALGDADKPITRKPALQRLFVEPTVITKFEQFSKLNFDYFGFYAASVTISQYEAGASVGPSESKGVFEMKLDRPFLFEVKTPVNNQKLPVVVGTIFDPAWEE